MKQEVWKWHDDGQMSRLLCPEAFAGPGPGSASADASWYYFRVYYHVVGGVDIKSFFVTNSFDKSTLKEHKLMASKEIQRQLAAQGVRCEIRMVKP